MNPCSPTRKNTDVYLAALGIVVTIIYVFGFILRPQKRILRLGLDSWLVLITYVVGIAGLLFLTNAH